MRRRDFIKVIAGSAVWPLAANAQPSNRPVIGFLSARSAKESAHLVEAFRKGLAEYGLVEGQNVIIDYRREYQFPLRRGGVAPRIIERLEPSASLFHVVEQLEQVPDRSG
jgi:hypothetical protein